MYNDEALNPVLPERLFRAHIIPELYKIFHVRDGAIRLVLLYHFPRYVHLFDKDTLQGVILPQVFVITNPIITIPIITNSHDKKLRYKYRVSYYHRYTL